MKLPPIEVSSSYVQALHEAYHQLGAPLVAHAKLCQSCDTRRCAPHRELRPHRAGSDNCWIALVHALDHQEMVWS